jgi:putative heme iron utilization protein
MEPPMDRDAVRELVESSDRGILSTLEPGSGIPYGSIVEVLPISLERIVFLMSDLAEHTEHLEHDVRCSLLIAEDLGRDNLLEHPRSTLLGRMSRVEGETESLREDYLELHPHAEQYIDFEDFRFYDLEVERIRHIGGFGEMGWLNFETS